MKWCEMEAQRMTFQDQDRHIDMFSKELHQAGHVRRFSITENPGQGWEVREEEDSQIVRSVLHRDWHRVERAKARMELQVVDLEQRGWRS
jgi:hypothetical protein